MPVDLNSIRINRQHSIPLSRQLYVQLHQQILQGQIIFKERLPASRQLASQLNVSRGIIVESYDMLKTDGLVAGFGKGGTQVSYQNLRGNPSHPIMRSNLSISQRGKRITAARHYEETLKQPLPLTPGVPDFSLFPYARWQSLSRQAMKSAPSWYQRDSGLSLLKKSMTDYLSQYRGLRVEHPDQLLVTTGSQSALSLLARLLADPGDLALIEQPCWSGAEAAMLQAGLNILNAPVDDQGIQIDFLKKLPGSKSPKIAVITPSIQFPTGRPMSMERREALLSYTASQQCWLIEDDYAAEYSYAQHPAPSIMAHSATDHVIHVGTMSKLLIPGLRIGWMVVPGHISKEINTALNISGILPPYMLQQQLALFMRYGYLSTHLSQTRAIYNERRRLCSSYLKHHAKDLLTQTASISGMNLYLKVNPQTVYIAGLSDRLQSAQLGCDMYTQKINNKNEYFLLLGHANLNEEVMAQQLDHLITVLSDE